jgi:hypothetical protein
MRHKRILGLVTLLAGVGLVVGCGEEAPVAPGGTLEATLDEATDGVDATIAQLEKMSAELLSLEPSAGGHIEIVPAGSVDALEAAIVAAGRNGVVLVESGMHTESGMVTVSHRITIVGMPGAVVQVDTQPTSSVGIVDPALYVFGASGTVVYGLEIVPTTPLGGTGILVESSERVTLARNTITGHEFGVLLEQADRATVWGNTIATGAGGQHGITVVNAERSLIIGNDVSSSFFGIWACDKRGRLFYNNVHDNFVGIILCTVPAELPLPSGGVVGAEFSCTNWVVRHNEAANHLDAAYLVIDGANNNFLTDNAASGSGTYDMELVGDSFRFGFLTPTSFENTAIIDDPDFVVKDCGLDNTVIGGDQVDIDLDPCF